MLWFYENDSFPSATFFSIYKNTADTFNKSKRYHMTSDGLSSVCAKLEPTSYKNIEILEINVLQKFTSHALSQKSLSEIVSSQA